MITYTIRCQEIDAYEVRQNLGENVKVIRQYTDSSTNERVFTVEIVSN